MLISKKPTSIRRRTSKKLVRPKRQLNRNISEALEESSKSYQAKLLVELLEIRSNADCDGTPTISESTTRASAYSALNISVSDYQQQAGDEDHHAGRPRSLATGDRRPRSFHVETDPLIRPKILPRRSVQFGATLSVINEADNQITKISLKEEREIDIIEEAPPTKPLLNVIEADNNCHSSQCGQRRFRQFRWPGK